MKHTYLLIFGVFFISQTGLAQYCIPPSFLTGPFTGISNVSFGDLDNSTLFEDGYSDYTSSVNVEDYMRGSTYPISVDLVHDITNSGFSDSLDVRIWIDWNQDEDFNDAGEEVVSRIIDLSSINATLSESVQIPSNAVLGNTRMRVYNDMLPVDGHAVPNPCGYNSGIGQHGECEDYNINVIGNNTGIKDIDKEQNELVVFPNPASSNVTIESGLFSDAAYTLKAFNVLGDEISITETHYTQLPGQPGLILHTASLDNGIYIIKVEGNGSSSTTRLIVRH